jgi:hypothetical protein
MWIRARIEIVTPLPVIVVLPIQWGLCSILSSFSDVHTLVTSPT